MNTNTTTVTTFKLVRKSTTREWIVRRYVNGVLDADSDYYTDDKADAVATMKHLESGYATQARADQFLAAAFPAGDIDANRVRVYAFHGIGGAL